MGLHPRHRGDCFEFFTAPDQTELMAFQCPATVRSELEQAAARTGRTWNDQLCYVVDLCRGHHPPDFDDPRSVEDWRTLLGQCEFRFTTAEDWSPFTCLWQRRTP
jgi:hypothetical protein